MKIKDLHNWNLKPAEAIQLQISLAKMLTFSPISPPIRTVAGLDCAFTDGGKSILAVAVVLKFPDLELIETKSAKLPVKMPYIPGLLSFREAPACIAAARKLKNTPDLFLIDGQGIAHPRRLGLAAHMGLFLDTPTIGCAKSRLIGQYNEPAAEKGSSSPLKYKSQTIGAVLRTRTNVKPLFISPGHKCALEDAVQYTLKCTIKYRLPEPTRLAHQIVTKLKRS
jgi:deoxyribonuclease V